MTTEKQMKDPNKLREELLKLTVPQAQAIQSIANGSTHAEAADAAKVERETVTRWANHHPAFMATLNRYRFTMVAEQIDTARSLRAKALGVVELALEDGDRDIALAVLKLIAAEQTSAIGPTDPAAILDTATSWLRANLPPLACPRDSFGLPDALAALSAPSDAERADDQILQRLAIASGIL